ncbi:MAG: metallophosphoesterase [Lautropia sp.]
MKRARIAVVTDIHHGADHFTKKGSAALDLLGEFRRGADEAGVDLVIDLGDRISDVGREADLAREREVAEVFDGMRAPRMHLCGNHDRDHLTVDDNADIFAQPMTSATLEVGDWTIVLWQADTRIRRPGGFVLPESDLLWLHGVVRAASRPLAVFTHVPLSDQSQVGNYWFERNPRAATYPDGADRARAILATASVPVVCVAGHVHWNTLTFASGRPHLTLQSLTETFTTHPRVAGSWALLELGESIDWTVHGNDRMRVSIPTETAARSWVTPLPRFADHPEIRERLLATPAR